jgi:hypothetical protein
MAERYQEWTEFTLLSGATKRTLIRDESTYSLGQWDLIWDRLLHRPHLRRKVRNNA